MKKKKLLLDVSCINENFNEAPEHLIVELCESDIERIKFLAKKVKELDVYSMEYFDYSGEYFSTETLEDALEENECDVSQLTDEMLEAFDSVRMEVKQIVVFEDAFKFTAVPKHCDDSELCCTGQIKVGELDTFETLSTISH